MRHWVCEANAAIFFIEPDFWENSKGVLFGKKKGRDMKGGPTKHEKNEETCGLTVLAGHAVRAGHACDGSRTIQHYH